MNAARKLMGMAIAIGVIVAGCATIASGSSQLITVSSNVDGAEVYLDDEKIGTTPFTGTVKKGKETLRLEAPGFRNETLSLSKSLDPMFWGNIIIGGTLGSITDFASGAAYQYAPAAYQVELRDTGQSEEAFLQQLVVRKFAMIYIDEISRDVAAGNGEYLASLVDLMTTDSGHVSATRVAAALEASGGDPLVFGHEVVDLL